LFRSVLSNFPGDSLHLVIVDPGVGTDRHILAARTNNGVVIVPDNGILEVIAQTVNIDACLRVDCQRFATPSPCPTFHGRDVFAPIVVALLLGKRFEQLGDTVVKPRVSQRCMPRVDASRLIGEVVHVDHFGNLITNLDPEAIGKLGCDVEIQVGGGLIHGICKTFAFVPSMSLGCVFGSFNTLEIVVNGGSAASTLSIGIGSPVRVRKRQ